MRVTPEFPPVEIFGGSETDKISRCINSSPNLSEYQMVSQEILSKWISYSKCSLPNNLEFWNFEFQEMISLLKFPEKLNFIQNCCFEQFQTMEQTMNTIIWFQLNMLNEVQLAISHVQYKNTLYLNQLWYLGYGPDVGG